MHQTKIRPQAENYGIWCARRKMQRKAINDYIRRGTVLWRSNILLDIRKKPTDKPLLKTFKLQGTYRNDCVLCGNHVKKCTCGDVLGE